MVEGETIDIRTPTPSANLNACSTIYNFYAVNREGTYAPEGKFTLTRNSRNPLAGMVIAPQGNKAPYDLTRTQKLKLSYEPHLAHIIDGITGSFSGQVIANSYEAQGEGVKINDYMSTGNEQCQSFAGCSMLM